MAYTQTKPYGQVSGSTYQSFQIVDGKLKVVNEKMEILAADKTAETSDTNTVTITQTGIKEYSIFNPSTVTVYVNFGTNPVTGNQLVLLPGMADDQILKTSKNDMRYRSSAAGGYLVYKLLG
jgi:hypothetical protein